MRRETQLLQKLDRRMPPATRLNGYERARFSALSRRDQLLEIYGAGIEALERGDSMQARKVLHHLRQGVRAETAPEFAFRLLTLYRYCEHCIDIDAIPEALRILETLRQTWQMADRQPQEA